MPRSRLDYVNDWAAEARTVRYDPHKLAKLCGVSISQLRRYFVVTFGKPVKYWLNELRLCDAMRLILTGSSGKEVAFELGFCDAPQFCPKFKHQHGCTPSEFIRLYHRRSAASWRHIRSVLGSEATPALLPPPPWEIAERNLCQKNARPRPKLPRLI